jgi:hypothetical protein
MDTNERRNLVTSWLALRRNWWAMEALHRQIEKEPQEAWQSLLGLLEAADNELLETIGAGPLEDFLRAHAREFVAVLESEAGHNAKLRTALERVWIPRGEDEVTLRLVKLGCKPVEAAA